MVKDESERPDKPSAGSIRDTAPDWRRDNGRSVDGFTLHHQPYQRWSEAWDHDHCAACGDTFSLEVPDGLRAGYATGDDYPLGACYEWVCETCFRELAAERGWRKSQA